MPRRLAVALTAALAVLVVAALAGWWWAGRDRGLAGVVALAPEGAQRVTFTDWAGVRAEVGVSGRGAESLTELLDRGYDRDLVSASALVSSAEAMRASLGVSPGNAEWEMFSQSPEGAAVVVKVPASVSFDDLGSSLESLGYSAPDDPGGVWAGGADVASTAGFTPELQYVALLEDSRLLVASDQSAWAAEAAGVAAGDGSGAEDLTEVAEAAGEPLSAVVYAGEYACEELAMAQADPAEAEQGEALVEAAGDVSPLASFAMAAQPGGSVRVLMTFETDERARSDADARARLASGPAPGQGGDFPERFRLGEVRADGTLLTMTLRPRPGAAVLSDLSSGPVLFASC